MSKSLSKRDNAVKRNLSGWDKAIADCKKGILRLQVALRDCQEKKRSGEPWPGTQAGSHSSEATTQC